ncbi:unnamed protein product [Sphagnum jensenii]|uniref:Uncharacterized protein n=1 Tax=Sphagnum jensenii TaxID=128206 RepID=A0ABP1ACQ7_9BRYO
MGLATRAAADASITFLWVFSMASLGAVSSALAPIIGLQGGSGKLYVVLALVTLLIFVFSALGKALGGASWNPTSLVAFAYAGVSKDTLFSLGIRMPAQMIGAVAGALAILEVMPKKYSHTLGGPKLKVPLSIGLLAEAVLTFALTLTVLWAILRGPRSPSVKTGIIVVATIILVMAGGAYTGPAMNPANAFAWAFVSNEHTSWQHFAVYWIGPMVGTVVSVWAFNLLFAPKRPVQKGNAAAAAAVNGESDRKAEVVKDGSVKRRAKRATQEESAKEE